MVRSYVLCGGRSRRFGRDKARVEVRGRPLLLHVAAALDAVAPPVSAVADRPGRHDDLGVPTLGDAHPGSGPLAGIEVALADARAHGARAALVAPTDLLDLDPGWLRTLLAALPGAGTDAPPATGPPPPDARRDVWSVAFASGRGPEPLPVLLDVAIADEVSARVTARDRSLRGLLAAIPLRTVPRPPDWHRCRRITVPSDLPPPAASN